MVSADFSRYREFRALIGANNYYGHILKAANFLRSLPSSCFKGFLRVSAVKIRHIPLTTLLSSITSIYGGHSGQSL
jgi:hypothetical protein